MNLETIKGAVAFTAEEAGYQGERLEVLDNHFRKMLQKEEVLCAGYALSRNGRMFANNALGDLDYSDRGGKKLLPTSTFRIASITKIFTAVAILKLVEDGMMTLDQPVGDFIPEFQKEPFNKVKVLHLLNHTSGLAPDGGVLHNEYYVDWDEFVKEDPEKEWISAILKCGMRRDPGVEWCYCTAGFTILGEIITRVSGEFCHDYIENQICKPCGMTNTTFDITKVNLDNTYVRDEWMKNKFEKAKRGEIQKDGWSKIPSTGGGLFSTCEDLIKFGNMLVNNGKHEGNRIIGRKALEAMFRNTTEPTLKNYAWDAGGAYKAYGVGIDIYTWNDKSQLITPGLVNHEGYGPSCLMIDPEEKFVAVWSAQFKNYDIWYPHALRNVSSIMWSGLE